jgi:DNA repair protein RadC
VAAIAGLAILVALVVPRGTNGDSVQDAAKQVLQAAKTGDLNRFKQLTSKRLKSDGSLPVEHVMAVLKDQAAASTIVRTGVTRV